MKKLKKFAIISGLILLLISFIALFISVALFFLFIIGGVILFIFGCVYI